MRFRLARSALLTAFVTDLDTAVQILPGFAAPGCGAPADPRGPGRRLLIDRFPSKMSGGSARPGQAARMMRPG